MGEIGRMGKREEDEERERWKEIERDGERETERLKNTGETWDF